MLSLRSRNFFKTLTAMENPIIFAGENPDDMNYPIGIQTFKGLRAEDYAYVDKTAYVYRLVSRGKCYFLSRPRRFGKSMLLSTLKTYFQGKKEEFEGLAISKLEKEWKPYPVLHLDLNVKYYESKASLIDLLARHLEQWEAEYGIKYCHNSVEDRFFHCIVNAAQQSPEGKVVILIDEYDKPLLEAIGKPELQEEYRQILKAFYSNIKSCDEYIRFAMLTGVTKFSHLSIFSGLNNLNDISLDETYAALCGFTQNEIETTFGEGIDEFAEKLGIDRKEMLERLKRHYDGYHFSSDLSVSVYNPFSLICALSKLRLDDFWFATGTPTFLYKQMKENHTNLLDLEKLELPASQFDASFETMNSVKTALGRADVVVFMNDATYVMELKIGGTAQEALEQINSKDYAVPYQDTSLPVVKIGIGFSREKRTVSEWVTVSNMEMSNLLTPTNR